MVVKKTATGWGIFCLDNETGKERLMSRHRTKAEAITEMTNVSMYWDSSDI
jgi:hypothetical protein